MKHSMLKDNVPINKEEYYSIMLSFLKEHGNMDWTYTKRDHVYTESCDKLMKIMNITNITYSQDVKLLLRKAVILNQYYNHKYNGKWNKL